MKIVMLGNADPTGKEAKNVPLSQSRANAVYTTFLKPIKGFEAVNVATGSIIVKGVGSTYSNSIKNDRIKSYKASLGKKNMSTQELLASIQERQTKIDVTKALTNDRRLELFFMF